MRYVWIVMLIIIYVIWLIAVICDVYKEIKYGFYRFPHCLAFLELYSYAFIISHLFTLFLYSLYVWRNTL